MVGAAGAASAAGAAGVAAGAAGTAGAACTACAVAAAELQATHRRHRWRTGSRRSYRLHSGGSGGGLETSRSGAGGGLEPADIEGARSRSHGPAAERPELGLGEPESTHCAGPGQPAGPRHSPAPTGVRRGTSDGHGWIGSKAVEMTGSRVGRAAIQDSS